MSSNALAATIGAAAPLIADALRVAPGLNHVSFIYSTRHVMVKATHLPGGAQGAHDTIALLIDRFSTAGWGVHTRLDDPCSPFPRYTGVTFGSPATLTRF